MNIAVVLCASSLLWEKSIGACNAFIDQYGQPHTWQAWLIAPNDRDESEYISSFAPLAIRDVTLVPVRDVHDSPSVCATLAALYEQERPDALLFEGSIWGDEQAALAAAHHQSDGATGVHAFTMEGEESLTIQRMTYANTNNLAASIPLTNKPFCLSLDRGKPNTDWPAVAHDVRRFAAETSATSCIVESEWQPDPGDSGLSRAPVVVAVGRASGSRGEIDALAQDCATIDVALGVSRAVSMNGWAQQNQLLGVSGQMISPELCIVLGASGAAAFMAGVDSSQCIVAINTDPDALIFQRADIGILADYRALWKALLPLLQTTRSPRR